MKKVLVVIDMQNDFIDMALGTKEAQAIVPYVKAKIAEYKSAGNRIIYTRDTHYDNYSDTAEGRKLPVAHCIKESKGWQIADGLYVDGCEIINKPNFGWLGWDKAGFENSADFTVEIIGLCTDICVVSNALIIKTMYPESNVVVDSACCAGVTPETHSAALETMKMCQIDII